jgi:hypothetical protein
MNAGWIIPFIILGPTVLFLTFGVPTPTTPCTGVRLPRCQQCWVYSGKKMAM